MPTCRTDVGFGAGHFERRIDTSGGITL